MVSDLDSTTLRTVIVGDVRVGVVLDQYRYDVITAQFARVAERRAADVVSNVDVGTT